MSTGKPPHCDHDPHCPAHCRSFTETRAGKVQQLCILKCISLVSNAEMRGVCSPLTLRCLCVSYSEVRYCECRKTHVLTAVCTRYLAPTFLAVYSIQLLGQALTSCLVWVCRIRQLEGRLLRSAIRTSPSASMRGSMRSSGSPGSSFSGGVPFTTPHPLM